jgi:hypothetical protein
MGVVIFAKWLGMWAMRALFVVVFGIAAMHVAFFGFMYLFFTK